MQAKVYWNFHRKCFSVQVNGRVVAHATSVALYDVRFRVSPAGRARVLREKRKNVHAFVTGTPVASYDALGKGLEVGHARYNPYANETFVDDQGREVRRAWLAVLEARDGRPEVRWLAGRAAGDRCSVRQDRGGAAA